MTSTVTAAPAAPPALPPAAGTVRAYARFSRRFRALALDTIVYALLFYVGALAIHAAAWSDDVRQGLWLALIATMLLYEPVLVATLGGTVGHIVTNLRVVDDRTGGNPGFFKAVARGVIKLLLGWFSFVSMALTRRNQALHDVLTHSTVQIRNPALAAAHHSVAERDAVPATEGLPPRWRRAVVILVYVFLSYVVLSMLSVAVVTDDCALRDRCSTREGWTSFALSIAWVAFAILCAIAGWQGRLWGCRSRAGRR
jgi:uncharacterized RDD family membrane protein YckC